MRTLITVVAVAAVVWLPGNVCAQGKGAIPGEAIQDLHLTDAQEAKIAEIRNEFKTKVKAASKSLAELVKEEVEKVRGILTDEQKNTLKALKEENKEHRAKSLAEKMAHFEDLDLTEAEMTKIADIRKEFQPKIMKAMESLKGLLSPEQKEAREDALKAGKKHKEIIAMLKLSDDQKEKLAAVGKEIVPLVREEMEKVRDVLTEGQKEKLLDFKEERKEQVRDHHCYMISTLKSLNLTDQQKSQIAAIRKEYRPKIQEAGNALRAVVREELQAIISAFKG